MDINGNVKKASSTYVLTPPISGGVGVFDGPYKHWFVRAIVGNLDSEDMNAENDNSDLTPATIDNITVIPSAISTVTIPSPVPVISGMKEIQTATAAAIPTNSINVMTSSASTTTATVGEITTNQKSKEGEKEAEKKVTPAAAVIPSDQIIDVVKEVEKAVIPVKVLQKGKEEENIGTSSSSSAVSSVPVSLISTPISSIVAIPVTPPATATVPASTATAVTVPASTATAVTVPASTAVTVTVPASTATAVTVPASTATAVTVPASTATAVTVPASTAVTVPASTATAVTVPASTVPASTATAVTVAGISSPADEVEVMKTSSSKAVKIDEDTVIEDVLSPLQSSSKGRKESETEIKTKGKQGEKVSIVINEKIEDSNDINMTPTFHRSSEGKKESKNSKSGGSRVNLLDSDEKVKVAEKSNCCFSFFGLGL